MSISYVENRALVFLVAETLDARAGNRMRRLPAKLRRASQSEAVVDLRATRRTSSEGWGALIGAVRLMNIAGNAVTVLMRAGLRHLAELSGLKRHARVIFFEDRDVPPAPGDLL